jgi:hypothetical protein
LIKVTPLKFGGGGEETILKKIKGLSPAEKSIFFESGGSLMKV